MDKITPYPRVAISSDGKIIAATIPPTTVKIFRWNEKLKHYELINTIEKQSNLIDCITVSPDGKYVAFGANKHSIKVFDINNNKEPRLVFEDTKNQNASDDVCVLNVKYDYTGTHIASCTDNGFIGIWRVSSEEKIIKDPQKKDAAAKVPNGNVNCVALAIDPVALESFKDNTEDFDKLARFVYCITSERTENDKKIKTGILNKDDYDIVKRNKNNHISHPFNGAPIIAVEITKDRSQIVTASMDHKIRLLSINNTSFILQKEYDHGDVVRSLAITPDAQIIVSGGNNKLVKIWDTEKNQIEPIYTYEHNDRVTGVAISQDSKIIASVSSSKEFKVYNPESKEMTVYDLSTGKFVETKSNSSTFSRDEANISVNEIMKKNSTSYWIININNIDEFLKFFLVPVTSKLENIEQDDFVCLMHDYKIVSFGKVEYANITNKTIKCYPLIWSDGKRYHNNTINITKYKWSSYQIGQNLFEKITYFNKKSSRQITKVQFEIITKEALTLTSIELDNLLTNKNTPTKESAAINNPEITKESLPEFDTIPKKELIVGVGNVLKFEIEQKIDTDFDLESMSDPLLETNISEQDLIAHIIEYISDKGYYYDEETIINFHISLKTKPFVILSGISGSGKTKLVQLYAQAIGAELDKEFIKISVRPSWNDDSSLLGFFNPMNDTFYPEPLSNFILKASSNPSRLYFVCLDEMNLARVEYYFSGFLSAMEGDNEKEKCIRLYDSKIHERLENESQSDIFPDCLYIPDNIFFVGTVNIDETTHSFSDKVLDRANTIEFVDVKLGRKLERSNKIEPIKLSMDDYQTYKKTLKPKQELTDYVLKINDLLKPVNLNFGHRVFNEIESYLANSNGLLDESTALDIQIKQKILPKIKGLQKVIDNKLEDLLTDFKDNGFTRSYDKLNEMKTRLTDYGSTSFFR